MKYIVFFIVLGIMSIKASSQKTIPHIIDSSKFREPYETGYQPGYVLLKDYTVIFIDSTGKLLDIPLSKITKTFINNNINKSFDTSILYDKQEIRAKEDAYNDSIRATNYYYEQSGYHPHMRQVNYHDNHKQTEYKQADYHIASNEELLVLQEKGSRLDEKQREYRILHYHRANHF